MLDTATDRIRDPALVTRTELGSIIAVLTGVLDITRVPGLREQFLHLLRPASSRLVMDMSLVSHVDADGLAFLVGTGRRARLLGGSLRLAAVTPAVSAALRVAGLDRFLEVFPTVQSAVSSPVRA
jgi:anti-sigma B factor antagonist